MADDVNSTPAQPENNNAAPKMPQISIMPKPEPLKVNLTQDAKTQEEKNAAPVASVPKQETVNASMPPATEAPKTDVKSDDKSDDKAAPKATPDAKPESNVFTQLFGDDKVMQSSDLMDTVNKKDAASKKSVFSKKPTLKSVKENIKAKSKNKGQIGKALLRVSFLLLIVTGGFFYTQNNTEFSLFGINPAQKAELAHQELLSAESEINVQKHLSAVLLLDQFSSVTDSYLYNLEQSKSDVNSSNKQESFAESADENMLDAANLLAQIQDNTEVNLSAEQKVAATTLISELITQLEAKEGEVDAGDLSQDIQDLETTRSLIQSDEFRSSLAGVNLEELDEDVLESLLNGYTDLNKSQQAVIGKIRNERIDWSDYFTEIETLTKKVDPLFNTEFPGSLYIYDIKMGNDGISISGGTVTDDTKNFTLISNYIDTLESSSSFMNVEERSFNKSLDEEDYTGEFRISLELENEQ